MSTREGAGVRRGSGQRQKCWRVGRRGLGQAGQSVPKGRGAQDSDRIARPKVRQGGQPGAGVHTCTSPGRASTRTPTHPLEAEGLGPQPALPTSDPGALGMPRPASRGEARVRNQDDSPWPPPVQRAHLGAVTPRAPVQAPQRSSWNVSRMTPSFSKDRSPPFSGQLRAV